MNRHKIKIVKPTDSDFENIKKYIKYFELDDRVIEKQQFLVAKKNIELLGFGRIKIHQNCDEICSIGIKEKYRRRGIASLLVKELINLSSNEIYLVSINPDLFKKLGFSVVSIYPDEIKNKLNYCKEVLVVPEKYVVMKHQQRTTIF
jgi:N-acetylglutamate synthase-like GNAT family acetyltransferase